MGVKGFVAGLALGVVALGFGQADSNRVEYFVVGKDAFVLGPPSSIGEGLVQQFIWTADGKAVYFIRQIGLWDKVVRPLLRGQQPDPNNVPTYRLSVYDIENRRLRDVFETVERPDGEASFDALPGTGFLTMQKDGALFLVTPSGARKVAGVEAKEGEEGPKSFSVFEPATGFGAPMGALLESVVEISDRVRRVASRILLVGPNGSVRGVPLPKVVDDSTMADSPRWVNGELHYYATWVRPPSERQNANIKNRFFEVRLNPRTGQSTVNENPSINREPYVDEELRKPILMRETRKVGKQSVSAYAVVFPVQDDGRVTTLLPGRATASISPTNNYVAYNFEGLILLRPLLKADANALMAMEKAAKRNEVMSNAKQVGTGLMMYASDYDDVMPGQDGDIKEMIMPYLKNAEIMEGFVYTFAGGDMTKIESPAETQIGYVQGDGGRAVIYADGHVKWVDDPKGESLLTWWKPWLDGERAI